MKRSQLFFSVLLVPVDALSLLAAFVLSYRLRDEYGLFAPAENLAPLAARLNYLPQAELTASFDRYVHYLGFIIPGMVVIFALLGLYAIRSTVPWTKRAFQVLVGVSAGECFILLLFLLKKDFFIPRSTVLYSWVLAAVFVLVARSLMRLAQRSLYRYQIGVIRTAVIGAGTAGRTVAAMLAKDPAYRIDLHVGSLPVEEVLQRLEGIQLDELVVVNERYGNEELIALRNYCLERMVAFSFVPSLLTELQSSFEVRTLSGLPAIEVSPTPLEGWGRVVKRLFDVVVGSALILVFSPAFLLISLAIKLTSPGPLIYRHRRIGKNGEEIDVWKFRTMKWEFCTGVGGKGERLFNDILAKRPDLAKEWRENRKLRNDPRVSWIGGILRKTSLDELPQFFNAVGGSLSLVGPRPIVRDEVGRYGEGARILFSVKPGVTGLWQVSGRSDTSYEERIKLDTYYIEHWNVWRDIFILIKTAWVLVSRGRKGAY